MNLNYRKNSRNRSPRFQLPTWVSVVIFIALVAIYLYLQYTNPGDSSLPEPITPTAVAGAPSSTSSSRQAGNFDFYLLALSWSPDYCATSRNDDPQQCSIGKKLAFVLHGLWPQYERGYPRYCSNEKLPGNLRSQFPDLFPNTSLYTHEWEKHGTCTGLTPEQYLALSKQLKESVKIPAAYRAPEQPFRTTTTQLKQEFIAANPALSEANLAVDCSGSGRFLQELRVCFSLDGKPTACSREVQNDAARSCQAADFLVRNVK